MKIDIICKNGVWSTHSIDCSGEEVKSRISGRPDKHACDKCFNFDSIQIVRDRIRRMVNVLHVENFLIERNCSDTGYISVSKFLKTNVSSASPSTLALIKRCQQYVSHHEWMQDNLVKLKKCDVIDSNGKIYHEKWISKLSKMYHAMNLP